MKFFYEAASVRPVFNSTKLALVARSAHVQTQREFGKNGDARGLGLRTGLLSLTRYFS